MGKEKQFRFNQSVEARFDSAISAIEKKKLDKAKKEGKKLLSERQKLIKLADRSECGYVGPRFRLTLLTTWRILLKTNVVFLKLKNRQTRPLTLKQRNRGLNRVLLITNLIMLLFLMLLANSRLGADDASCQVLLTALSVSRSRISAQISVQERNLATSLMDRKDTGETAAPISFLQEDQISQPSEAFNSENSSDSCLFKVGSLREHVDFWSNSIRASDFIINTIVEG